MKATTPPPQKKQVLSRQPSDCALGAEGLDGISGDANGSAAVRVFVRIRPFSESEKTQNSSSASGSSCGPQPTLHVDPSDPQLITVLDPRNDFRSRETYGFERCFWSVGPTGPSSAATPAATQQHVFDFVGMPVLSNVLNGYNGCIFAYGQTGSGKTYTMMGLSEDNPSVASPLTLPPSSSSPSSVQVQQQQQPQRFSARDPLPSKPSAGSGTAASVGASGRFSTRPEDVGVIPRLATAIFHALQEKHEEDKSHSFRVEVSYYEIYNEKVFDLLSVHGVGGSDGHELRVRLDPVQGPFVEGLSTHPVLDDLAIGRLLRKGTCARHVAATRMNDRSSRSHAIFSLHVTQMRLDERNETVRTTSKLNLVDLAGSERTGQAGVDGVHFKESTRINLSLTTLGRVIDHLAESGHTGVPPYRESQLTWLLMDSLGGNSKTTMVATISPSLACYEEMLQTLRYASRAKQIVNKVVVNEDPQARRLKELEAIVAQLRTTIEQGGTNTYSNDYVDDLTSRFHESQRMVAELKSTVASLKCDVEHLQGQKKHLEAELVHEKELAARNAGMSAVAQVVKSRTAVPVLVGKSSTSASSGAAVGRHGSPGKSAGGARVSTGPLASTRTVTGGSSSRRASGTGADISAASINRPATSAGLGGNSLTTTPRTGSSCGTSPRSAAVTPTAPLPDAPPQPYPHDGTLHMPCPALASSSSGSRFERSSFPPKHVLGEMSTEHLVEIIEDLKADLSTTRKEKERLAVIAHHAEKGAAIAKQSEQVRLSDATARIMALDAKSTDLQKVIQSHEVQHADYLQLIEGLASEVEQNALGAAAANKKIASLLEAQSKHGKDTMSQREAREREALEEALKKFVAEAKRSSAAAMTSLEREVSIRVRSECKASQEKAIQALEAGWEAKLAQVRKALSEQLAEERVKIEQELSTSRVKQEASSIHEATMMKAQVTQLQHQLSALSKARTADVAEMERLRTGFDDEKRTLLLDHERRLVTLRKEVERQAAGKVQAAEEATRDVEALMRKKEVDHAESQRALRVCLEHEKERAVSECQAPLQRQLDRKTDEVKSLSSTLADRDTVIAELKAKLVEGERGAKRQDEAMTLVKEKVQAVLQQVAHDEASHRIEVERVRSDLQSAHAALLREVEETHDHAMTDALARQKRLEEEIQCQQELLHVDASEIRALQQEKEKLEWSNVKHSVDLEESIARRIVVEECSSSTIRIVQQHLCEVRLVGERHRALGALMNQLEVQRDGVMRDEELRRTLLLNLFSTGSSLQDIIHGHVKLALSVTNETAAMMTGLSTFMSGLQQRDLERECEAVRALQNRQVQLDKAVKQFSELESRMTTLEQDLLEEYARQASQVQLSILQLAAQTKTIISSSAEQHMMLHQDTAAKLLGDVGTLQTEFNITTCGIRRSTFVSLEASERTLLAGQEESDCGLLLLHVQAAMLASARNRFASRILEEHMMLRSSCEGELGEAYLRWHSEAVLLMREEQQHSESLAASSAELRVDTMAHELSTYRDEVQALRAEKAELTGRLRASVDEQKKLEMLLDEANLVAIERDLVGQQLQNATGSSDSAKKPSAASSRVPSLGGLLNFLGASRSSTAAASTMATSAGPSLSPAPPGKENHDPVSLSRANSSIVVAGTAGLGVLDLSGLLTSQSSLVLSGGGGGAGGLGDSKLRSSMYYNFTPRGGPDHHTAAGSGLGNLNSSIGAFGVPTVSAEGSAAMQTPRTHNSANSKPSTPDPKGSAAA